MMVFPGEMKKAQHFLKIKETTNIEAGLLLNSGKKPEFKRFVYDIKRQTISGRDPCKTPPFAQFLCQAQILILEILNVFLWLKFSPSLNLNEIEHFSKVSGNQR